MTSFLSMKFKELDENVAYDSCKCESNVKGRNSNKKT